MKTPDDVKSLKRDWLRDPCYEIELTEGFGEYAADLLAFSQTHKQTHKAYWDAEEGRTMSETRHTPGPWRHEYRDWLGGESLNAYVRGDILEPEDDDEGGRGSAVGLAIVVGNETSQPITEANARLIASAPELLAACEAALRCLKLALSMRKVLTGREDGGIAREVAMVEALIARVKGA